MGPGLYFGIGKQVKDLLNGGYLTDSKFTLTTITKDGVRFTSTGTNKNSQSLGEIQTHFERNGFITDIKVNSDAKLSTSITTENLGPGFKSIVSFVVPDQKSGKLELQYLHDYAGISTNFGLTASPVVNFAGVFGTKSLAVGTDVGFDTATGKFVKYNAGVSYKDVDYTLSLTLDDKGDSATSSYYHHVSPLTNTAVGGEFKRCFSSNENTITFGAQHALDPFTTIKARINNSGKINALIQHQPHSKFQVTFSGEVDTKAIDKSCKIRLGIALKP